MSSESQPEKKKIVLKSNDGEIFEVEEAVAEVSVTLKFLIEDCCASDPIPLVNVRGEVLAKVIDYCKKNNEYTKTRNECAKNKNQERFNNYKKDVRDWFLKFSEVDQSMLIELVMAADYLNIKSLLRKTLQLTANEIKGKTPEEIREIFKIENDFTPEEEEALRKDMNWTF